MAVRPSGKRAISLFFGAGLLVASLTVYAAYLRPAYDKVSMLRGTLIAKQNLFEEKKQAVDKVEQLIKQYQGAGKLQDVISMSLPTDEEVSSVFNQLQAIAGTNGLTVQVFNVQPLSTKPSTQSLVKPLGTLRLSLRLAGNYNAFKEFIKGLETNIRAMDIVSIKVESAGKGDFFMYTVVADTYYQAE
ncbi:MAG: hypothetical protein EXS60_02080 [Candidatus Pacebacteria bacterium]|nr:hypothetical protein [Candidatus Paceibacterota bacterium]